MWTITEPSLNREFQRWEQKSLHTLRIFVFLHGLMIWRVVPRSVWSDIVSWPTRRLNNSRKYLLHASMTTTSKRRRNEICWRIVTSMLSNFFKKCLYLARNWKARYSMVSEQICTINHKMGQSLWQTPESIDFINSSYMWIQTVLLCG